MKNIKKFLIPALITWLLSVSFVSKEQILCNKIYLSVSLEKNIFTLQFVFNDCWIWSNKIGFSIEDKNEIIFLDEELHGYNSETKEYFLAFFISEEVAENIFSPSMNKIFFIGEIDMEIHLENNVLNDLYKECMSSPNGKTAVEKVLIYSSE